MILQRAVTILGVVAATAAALAGCSDSDDDSSSVPPEDAVITYSFIESSTAPQYHREYVVTARNGVATVTAGPYGLAEGRAQPLATEQVELSSQEWRVMRSAAAEVPAGTERGDSGCAGGTTTNVEVSVDGKSVRSATVYACGQPSAAVTERITRMDAVIAPVTAKRDIDKIVDSTRKN